MKYDTSNTNKTPVVKRRPGYQLHEDGEMWRTGSCPYLCGCVSNPENIDTAIDAHEEEMRILLAQAREEFGI